MQHILRTFADTLVQHLPDAAPAIYLYGSLTLDDYRPGWSDIDLLALTRRPLTEAEADALASIRQTLQAQHPDCTAFRAIEGAVLPLDAFLSGQETRVVYWGTSGQRVKARHALSPFDLWLLHHHGVLLHGPELRPLLPCPTAAGLADGVRAHLAGIRAYGQGSASLYTFGWLLDIARGLYTLRTGQVIAKTAAGEWALAAHLCPDEAALRLALAVRRDPARMADAAVRAQAEGLGPAIQRFADVLERALT